MDILNHITLYKGDKNMKKEISSQMNLIKNSLISLSKYIYENPEKSFNEHKAVKKITELLNEGGFNVTSSFLDIDTAFYAEYGSGHPKVCFICEYDAPSEKGHIYASNITSAVSIGAALALSKVLKDVGTICVIGCPGEMLCSTKTVMQKQGIFDDIDAILMIQPHTHNSIGGIYNAFLPLKILFSKPEDKLSELYEFSTNDACILVSDMINMLNKCLTTKSHIDSLSTSKVLDPYSSSCMYEMKLNIESSELESSSFLREKLESYINSLSDITGIKIQVSLDSVPCDNFITNETLSRLFSHNLKEIGIIDIEAGTQCDCPLSLGTLSHSIPCIRPFVSIVDDKNIKFGTEEFSNASVLEFANNTLITAAEALALTAYDVMDRKELLREATLELSKLN